MLIHDLVPRRCGDGVWPWSLPGAGEAGRWLAGLGLRAGDRVALAGANQPATAQVLTAGLRGGLSIVLLNRRLHLAELAGQLARAACVRLLADPGHPAAGLMPGNALPTDFGHRPDAGGPPSGSLVLFTSGSTGQPKAARLGASALNAAVVAHVAALDLDAASLWACPLPLDHVGGAMCVLRALASGCRVRLPERFDAATLSAELDRGATGSSVVPTMLRRVLEVRGDRRWSPSLRRLLTGGGSMDARLAADCAALGLPPSQTYGLTEMGSMASVLDPSDWAAHPGSAGRGIAGARLRVVAGQIEVAGTMLFDGYEEAGRLIAPAGAWHATGDLGTLDNDGFLTVQGRIAERIVSGGENVDAREVEAALETHPAVVEAAVIGVPDAEWGEVVAAAVVLRGTVSTDELTVYCAGRLAGFKCPRRWRVVDQVPRSGAGKIRRAEVRRLMERSSN